MNGRPVQLEPAPITAANHDARHWRVAGVAWLLVLALLLYGYRDTALAMARLWSASETFTHGYIVPLISIWLAWQKRTALAALAPRPCYWVLLPLAAVSLIWLLGALASANVVSQFALVGLLVLTVPAVLGLAVARRLAFALAFLFFAVPFGEAFVPYMMEWTADFTVLALRLSGIPVYRDGLQFNIPSGNWSVVEACSGVRYLIASLMVGVLFAYLNYQSLRRRLLFIALAIIVPVIANWFRAYLIVMLGHLSGNQLATGVDHLIYGWLFFGVVILLMFWLGGFWREPVAEPTATLAPARAASPAYQSWLAALVTGLVLTAGPLALARLDQPSLQPLPQIAPLAAIPGWPAAAPFSSWVPHFRPPASLQTQFARQGSPVGLYLAYYPQQTADNKAISASNTLARSDDPNWAKVSEGSHALLLGDTRLTVRTAELAGNPRLIVWQWYWINGHLTSSAAWGKAYIALSRLLGQGDGAAVVMVYTPKQPGAEALLTAYLQQAWPAMAISLQRSGGQP